MILQCKFNDNATTIRAVHTEPGPTNMHVLWSRNALYNLFSLHWSMQTLTYAIK